MTVDESIADINLRYPKVMAYLAAAELPAGVHRLSQESQDVLARVKATGDAAEARFVKRVS